MYYSKKETQWISKMYLKGLTYNDIMTLHNANSNFPLRTKAAIQKYVSRYLIK